MNTAIEQKYKDILSTGLLIMLFVAILMNVVDINMLGMEGDFSALIRHPGMDGLWMTSIVLGMSIFFQMSIKTWDNKVLRWATFGFTVAYALFFAWHHVMHILGGEPFGVPTILDIVQHTTAVWSGIAAYKWASLLSSTRVVARVAKQTAS